MKVCRKKRFYQSSALFQPRWSIRGNFYVQSACWFTAADHNQQWRSGKKFLLILS
jgi:hypothetical protein